MSLRHAEAAHSAIKKIYNAVNDPTKEWRMADVIVWLEILDKQVRKFNDNHLMVETVEEAEIQAHVMLLEQVEQLKIDARAGLQEVMMELRRKEKRLVREVDRTDVLLVTMEAKLAHISIRPFDGTDEKGLEFWDLFCSLVDKNALLDDRIKFARLKELVDVEKVKQLDEVYIGG